MFCVSSRLVQTTGYHRRIVRAQDGCRVRPRFNRSSCIIALFQQQLGQRHAGSSAVAPAIQMPIVQPRNRAGTCEHQFREETPPLQAKSPEEICRLFQRYMAEGDVESLLSIYDSEAVVLTQSGRGKKGPGFEGAVGQCSCREASVRFQYQASDPVRRYRAHAH